MPYEIVRNDITQMKVDAIVNAANESLLGGGGVDGCIHRAAGPGLLAECRALGGCKTGDAKITKGYMLPAKYVIHTVGPVWRGGAQGEPELLASCYRRSLELARAHDCRTVAFPLISAGVYGYPKDQALKIAMDAIRDFLLENDMLVYIVIFDRGSLHISSKLYSNIVQYIDDNYVSAHSDDLETRRARMNAAWESAPLRSAQGDMPPAAKKPPARERRSLFRRREAEDAAASSYFEDSSDSAYFEDADASPYFEDAAYCPSALRPSLEEQLRQLDESFSQMVLRKIDARGMTDVQCYKKANLDRKLFSKIRSDMHYKPSKRTALALAIALELPMEEVNDLLMKAGYALSRSNKFDVIIEYFIRSGNYDILEINQALFDFDQQLLGA